MRIVVLGLALVAGCKELGNVGDLKKLLPEVQFEQLKVDEVDFQGLDAKFVLAVTNPYPVALDVAETSWKLGLAGSPFLDGTNESGLSIGASETSRVRIPFSLAFADAFAVVGGASGQDQLPYSLDVDLGFDSPVGRVNVPLHDEGDLPALHLPKLSLKGLRVARLDLAKQTATVELDVGLTSEQATALSFDTFGYAIKLAGGEVATGNVAVGPVSGSKTVTLPMELKLLSLGAAAVEAITKKGDVKVRLIGDASIGTPFGSVPLSFDEAAQLSPK